MLRRTGTFDDFYKRFITLSCRDVSLTEAQQIQLFITSLGDPLYTDVALQQPSSLDDAIVFDRAYEKRNTFQDTGQVAVQANLHHRSGGTMLWDPQRWNHPPLDSVIIHSGGRGGLQESRFIEKLVKNEHQIEGLPEDCNRVMVWNLNFEPPQFNYPPGWSLNKNLDGVIPVT
ncbi:hypothetical protein GUJ93_ZPchr0005g15018 [Zizania palustris]|uniref:Glycosyltransferases n=1 Tax=Zizania palustris TaxID=103762 RepID=A0A8J5SI02_ZIZPA|nr:hypothetical protein GUJ93_ZPchr0005g14745 [Zizania palustris]KAG8069343.1 hypothetical protein GUJ93_ZPchr0005g15018 [Zizania palustris]